MENVDFSLHEKFIALRNRAGHSQEKMAELAGIKFRTYQNIEYKRTQEISASAVLGMARALGITTDEILNHKMNPAAKAAVPSLTVDQLQAALSETIRPMLDDLKIAASENVVAVPKEDYEVLIEDMHLVKKQLYIQDIISEVMALSHDEQNKLRLHLGLKEVDDMSKYNVEAKDLKPGSPASKKQAK
ncbi:helix-turn-helix domain-containing protein [Bdellovibrio bacteriovorus]|uniref:helix-turn-helix domain-containing protein n=1 Tax=Bdellovibrio bacteriovorus TaxID=959 RepID=UPI003AA95180